MRTLILVHRWLGVAFCLLFAMWFATGIVMHFVSFLALTEAERIGGLGSVDAASLRHGPAAAVAASRIHDATRVRLLARADGLVYLVQGESGMNAVNASDLSPADVQSGTVALAIAADHARRRGMNATLATFAELASYDQWTVSNGLDPHRPLHRIALNDGAGTELYVSSATGEVVRDTTRSERGWNYAGSVAHWIYPTVLRRDQHTWDTVVWTLSLIALITAIAGALLGTLRIKVAHGRLVSPYQSWHAWHHWLGLACMTFVLTWIFSGWLSMDHGLLFSTGKLTTTESVTIVGAPAWGKLSSHEIELLPKQAREIEWFAFDGRIYRRERFGLTSQRLSLAGDGSVPVHVFLQSNEVSAGARRLAPDCSPAIVVQAADDYPVASAMPDAPVYRSVCGDVWFHFDGANGAVLERLDASRRAYRWVYGALHTLDFPALVARPLLRTTLVVMLCGFGLAFSVTGVVIGWRRLRRDFDSTTVS
jgi:hypothetical protein